MSSLEDLSDADLLEVFCVQNSNAALALLAERYRPLVFGVAFGCTHERQAADLATEHVFSRLARDARTIRGRVPLFDWLRHAAEDECEPEPET